MMKIIKEDSVIVPSDFIEAGTMGTPELVNAAIQSERSAIEEYNYVLATATELTNEDIDHIHEILNDEQDHIVILSRIYSRLIHEEFPDNGED